MEQMQSSGQSANVVVSYEDGENCCRIDMEAPFSDLMPTRESKADTSKSRQKYGGGSKSKVGSTAKVNGTLGWVLNTAVKKTVEKRPDEKGLLDNGLAHLRPISNLLEINVKGRPNEEGMLVSTDDYGPIHLGPIVNNMEVG